MSQPQRQRGQVDSVPRDLLSSWSRLFSVRSPNLSLSQLQTAGGQVDGSSWPGCLEEDGEALGVWKGLEEMQEQPEPGRVRAGRVWDGQAGSTGQSTHPSTHQWVSTSITLGQEVPGLFGFPSAPGRWFCP